MTGKGMTATLAPALLLLCGAAAGPHGLAILTQPVLSFLDPAAPVALAVFGILAAMRIQATDDEARSTVTTAALQAAITGTIVAGAFLLVPASAATGEPLPGWNVAAITLGIAAATSLDAEDCILPVIAGGLLLAFARETSSISALLITLEAGVIAAVIAGSGWLLLSRTSAVDEHRVSTFGSALLLGGAALAARAGASHGGCTRRVFGPGFRDCGWIYGGSRQRETDGTLDRRSRLSRRYTSDGATSDHAGRIRRRLRAQCRASNGF
jgi:hypothetical protein